MSTDANAALAWPIEVTEPATIGEQLVGRKKTPKEVTTLWTYLEMADGKREPGDLKGSQPELCGTAIPGNVRLACLDGNRRPSTEDKPEAGMWWSEAAMAWRVRPFIGSPESDPRVNIEGTETGYWAITAEGTKLLPHGRYAEFENHEAPMGGDGVYRADVG